MAIVSLLCIYLSMTASGVVTILAPWFSSGSNNWNWSLIVLHVLVSLVAAAAFFLSGLKDLILEGIYCGVRQSAHPGVGASGAYVSPPPGPGWVAAEGVRVSVASRLRELQDLLDAGLITQEEYQHCRAQVLERV